MIPLFLNNFPLKPGGGMYAAHLYPALLFPPRLFPGSAGPVGLTPIVFRRSFLPPRVGGRGRG